MSRIGYSEDEDYPGQFSLWRGNVDRSLAGRRGQQALRDLEAAMVALPEKRLISHHLVKDGDVCANGALVAYRRAAKGPSREDVLAQMREETAPACATCWCQKKAHDNGLCETCPEKIARRREYMAEHPSFYVGPDFRSDAVCSAYAAAEWDEDEDGEGSTEDVAAGEGVPRMVAWAIVEENDDMAGWRTDETEEERYTRVLAWVRSLIRKVPVPA